MGIVNTSWDRLLAFCMRDLLFCVLCRCRTFYSSTVDCRPPTLSPASGSAPPCHLRALAALRAQRGTISGLRTNNTSDCTSTRPDTRVQLYLDLPCNLLSRLLFLHLVLLAHTDIIATPATTPHTGITRPSARSPNKKMPPTLETRRLPPFFMATTYTLETVDRAAK